MVAPTPETKKSRAINVQIGVMATGQILLSCLLLVHIKFFHNKNVKTKLGLSTVLYLK